MFVFFAFVLGNEPVTQKGCCDQIVATVSGEYSNFSGVYDLKSDSRAPEVLTYQKNDVYFEKREASSNFYFRFKDKDNIVDVTPGTDFLDSTYDANFFFNRDCIHDSDQSLFLGKFVTKKYNLEIEPFCSDGSIGPWCCENVTIELSPINFLNGDYRRQICSDQAYYIPINNESFFIDDNGFTYHTPWDNCESGHYSVDRGNYLFLVLDDGYGNAVSCFESLYILSIEETKYISTGTASFKCVEAVDVVKEEEDSDHLLYILLPVLGVAFLGVSYYVFRRRGGLFKNVESDLLL